MSSRDQIQGKGTITAILKNGAYRIELVNGHHCVARSEKNVTFAPAAIGDSVLIAFHPYDLSRGRIVEFS